MQRLARWRRVVWRRAPPAARCGPAPRCSRSAAPPRPAAGRCATRSPSPPPTSSSPSRCRSCSRRSAGPAASASPTAARCSHYFRTTPDGRIAFGSAAAGSRLGARLRGRVELDPEVVALAAERLRDYFPGLEGPPTHPRLGRPDRRLADPPTAGRCRCAAAAAFAAAGYTGNGVGPSHMVGRTLASLALDRRDELLPPRLRRPRSPTRPPRALPLARRRRHPPRDHGARSTPSPRVDAPRLRQLRLVSRIPELIGFHIGR